MKIFNRKSLAALMVLAIAGTFLIDIRLGIISWLAAAAHEVPQELADFGVLVHGGWSNPGERRPPPKCWVASSEPGRKKNDSPSPRRLPKSM